MQCQYHVWSFQVTGVLQCTSTLYILHIHMYSIVLAIVATTVKKVKPLLLLIIFETSNYAVLVILVRKSHILGSRSMKFCVRLYILYITYAGY